MTSLPPPRDPDTLWILDLSSWARAAWELLRPEPDDLDDRSVVLATVRRFAALLEYQQPARLVVAVDSREPPWQVELWRDYKKDRKPPGPGYFEQVRVIRLVLKLHNIPTVEAPGFQADDVMATITRQARLADLLVVLITRDHDLWQLVDLDELVVAWGGGKEDPVINSAAVRDRYYGVGPRELADLMALAGDGDEAPGIPRIGDKTAARLILKHGSLDEVLRKWQWEKGAVSTALRDHADLARLSRKLVELRDVPMSFDLDEALVGWSESDAAAIRAMGAELKSETMQRVEALPPMVRR